MNSKKIKIVVPLVLILIILCNVSLAETKRIIINDETFSLDNKESEVFSKLNSDYNIESDANDENYELKQIIKELTKKTTYLLLGEANQKSESSEDYYKRHKDYLNLRYDPEVPKNENAELDKNSQEYQDDLLSGISVPGMFLMLSELNVIYNSYGDINISVVNDEIVLSTIKLPSVTMKEQDEEDETKYNYIETDLTIIYYFKKLDNEYKLLYLYCETNDEIVSYIENSAEKTGELSKDSNYDSELTGVYDFSNINEITDEIINQVYDENKSKIVFLNSTYNTGTVTSANGFFISDGLIITTYNYIETSLIKAQNITISNSLGEVFELKGIVTMDKENDIAILKVESEDQRNIEVKEIDAIEKEDAIITLNSKLGIGLTTSSGIVLATDNDIETSLPITEEMQGSPIFNKDGQLIGMINSQILDTSVSYATNINIIKKYYDLLSTKNLEDITSVSFEEIKEDYYVKYNDEKVINNIPEKIWQEYCEVEGITNNISLSLIKAYYEDEIISLRYKNEITNYIDTIQFASEYRENLKNIGYTETVISDNKMIYVNDKYKIIIMTDFDYLIVLMMKI